MRREAPAAAPAEKRLAQADDSRARNPRVAALIKELDTQPPEKWLERIQELRRQERVGDADELMSEFKRRFPAYR